MQTYKINNQQLENSNIIVNNFITISNQSILSPEIVFINKPISKNNKMYYKLFLNLNYNPNFVKEVEFNNIRKFENFDFKLFESKTLKEIKSSSKTPNQIIINNNTENNFNEIEYDIPLEMANNGFLNLNFGTSYKEGNFDFKGKGEITIDLRSKGGLNIDQNIVMLLSNKNENGEFFKSMNILRSFSKVILQPLTVNKTYDHLLEIENEFYQNIPKNILSNLRISEIISQIKNNNIFPLFKVDEVSFSNKEDFKKYYHGDLEFEFEKNSKESFYLKSRNKWVLNNDKRIIELKKSSIYEKIIFNSFSWSEEQLINFKLDLLGKKLEFEIPLSTFSKYYEWNEKYEFDFTEASYKKYEFNKTFWNDIVVSNDKELEERIKTYEI